MDFMEMLSRPEQFPLSFEYDGRLYSGLSAFKRVSDETRRTGDTTTRTAVFRVDDALKLTISAAKRGGYDASEFTAWFENDGDRDTGVITRPQCEFDIVGDMPVLKGIMGDHVNLYRPYEHDLRTRPVHFSCDSGRATHVCFPYFNLECGDGGALLAIGWAGTWMADFRYDDAATHCTLRSVNGLSARLHPGERIRTALFAILPYKGRDENAAMNLWRRWFIECNLPKADAQGTPFKPLQTACLADDTGLPNSDGSISERSATWRRSLQKMIDEGIAPDVRWFDAGWYIAPDGTTPESDWWGTVGTWELSPEKWPGDSFRESTDFAREHGMITMMWFEPERVTDVPNLVKNYGYRQDWAIELEGERAISNNIGDPDCFRWTVDRICRTLRDNRVEIYREDNNSNQAKLWRHLDTLEGDERTGITECKFIMAHYAMWDEIIQCTLSFGGCGFVDSCASGGGRNDLESLRRGVPFLRSDSDRVSTGLRLSMTTAFSRWIPVCGALSSECKRQLDPDGVHDMYIWRAGYMPIMNLASRYVTHPTGNFDIIRQGLNEWRSINKYLMKDMYVLTPWHFGEDTTGFTAIAYFDPDTAKGICLAFRQENCAESELTLEIPLSGLKLTDADTGDIIETNSVGNRSTFTLKFDEPRTAKLLYVDRD